GEKLHEERQLVDLGTSGALIAAHHQLHTGSVHAADGLVAILPQVPWMRAWLTHLLGAQTVPRGRHGQADDEVPGDHVGHQPFVIGNASMGPEWTVLQRVNARIHGSPHAFHTVHVHRHLFAHAMRIVRHDLESGRVVL